MGRSAIYTPTTKGQAVAAFANPQQGSPVQNVPVIQDLPIQTLGMQSPLEEDSVEISRRDGRSWRTKSTTPIAMRSIEDQDPHTAKPSFRALGWIEPTHDCEDLPLATVSAPPHHQIS